MLPRKAGAGAVGKGRLCHQRRGQELQLVQQRLLVRQLVLVAGEDGREIMFDTLACDQLQRHKIARGTAGTRKLGMILVKRAHELAALRGSSVRGSTQCKDELNSRRHRRQRLDREIDTGRQQHPQYQPESGQCHCMRCRATPSTDNGGRQGKPERRVRQRHREPQREPHPGPIRHSQNEQRSKEPQQSKYDQHARHKLGREQRAQCHRLREQQRQCAAFALARQERIHQGNDDERQKKDDGKSGVKTPDQQPMRILWLGAPGKRRQVCGGKRQD